MYRLANFCIFLILLPLLAALWVEGALFLSSLPNPKALLWFGAGMAGMLFLCVLLRGTALHFSEVATHEMTHALVGWPFMGKAAVINVQASPDGPGPGFTGWRTTATEVPFVVFIAPYSFPLLAIPPLVLRLLPFGQTPPVSLVIDAVLGAALAFHYVSIWDALRVQQSDFTTVGTIAGLAGAMTFQLLFLVVALSVVMGLPQLIGEYLWAALARARDYYAAAFGGALAGMGSRDGVVLQRSRLSVRHEYAAFECHLTDRRPLLRHDACNRHEVRGLLASNPDGDQLSRLESI